MDAQLPKNVLISAQNAMVSHDKAAFIVAIRVAQSQLGNRPDLVQEMEAAISKFPDAPCIERILNTI